MNIKEFKKIGEYHGENGRYSLCIKQTNGQHFFGKKEMINISNGCKCSQQCKYCGFCIYSRVPCFINHLK